MNLSEAQKATLKSDVLATPELTTLYNDGNLQGLADAYNLLASPDWFVWQTRVPTSTLYDAITWANMTPNDAPDGTQLWMNRALMCQGKQFNVQILLQGRDYIDASKVNIQTGLQDCLLNYPSGPGGTNRSAGWTAVRTAMQRKATRFEKLFTTGPGTAANPATMVLEGSVGYNSFIGL